MKVVTLILFVLVGCNPWIGHSIEGDAFTEVSQAFVTNFNDRDALVKIDVLPYTPKVVIALSKLRQQKEHWTDERYYEEVQGLMVDATGLAIDSASGRTASPNGWSATPQTLLLYVHLLNPQYPCQNTTIIAGRHMEKLFGLDSDIPCHQFYTDSLVAHITVNGVHASQVWGKRNDILHGEETLIVAYPVSSTNIRIDLK